MNAINQTASRSNNASNKASNRKTIGTAARGNLMIAVTTLALALGVAAASGCDQTFKPAAYVERTRVVGAVVSVDAEPGRAWVMPGEPTTVTWLTVSRQDAPPLQWSFALCLGGNGICAGAPLAVLSGQGPTAVVTFTTPDAATLGTNLSPILIGAICANGTLSFDAATMLPVCTGVDASGTNAIFSVPVQRAAETNHHPVLGDDRLSLGDVDWTATTAAVADAPCDASSGLPIVTAGKQKIRMISDANDRETYDKGAPGVAALEELQISQFTTAGKLAFSYSAIPATDTRPDADVTIEWDPPVATEIPASGLTVQFHFVARDLRGGIDWVHRALCVTAP